MKAIFKVEWKNGGVQLPELPEGADVSHSAMESIPGPGIYKTWITATEGVIEYLKGFLEFVEYIDEN